MSAKAEVDVNFCFVNICINESTVHTMKILRVNPQKKLFRKVELLYGEENFLERNSVFPFHHLVTNLYEYWLVHLSLALTDPRHAN